jgi:radical SAM superfamily enzyme YgiQ (UPF0313 family)
MNVLFINPPNFDELTGFLPEMVDQEAGFNPPLSILFLAGYLLDHTSHHVEIIDAQVEQLDYAGLEGRLKKSAFDVVGITVMSLTLIDVICTMAVVKKVNPECKIVVGGPHVHLFPEEMINVAGVDFAVMGEGEVTLARLLEHMDDHDALRGIKGLVYKDGEGRLINNGPSPVQDLDALSFPARHLTPYEKYSSLLAKRTPVTTMITSRGCPFKCTFCDRPHFGGKGFRAMSARRVVEEFETCLKMGIHEFLIYDDTFTVDKERVKDICRAVIEKKLDIGFEIRTRVDTVDMEMLALLKQAGCRGIHYGVEAGTEKILKVLQKKISLTQAKKIFDLTKRMKIQTRGYFMIGSPTETREDILETFRLARWLNPDYFHLSIFAPFPATKLYEDGLKNGSIKTDYWREYAQNPTRDFQMRFWEEDLSREELIELLKLGYRTYYVRPSYILREIFKVRSLPEFVRKAKAGLKVLFMK